MLLAAACTSGGNNTVTDTACSAQLKWNGGNSGSALMNPGMDCIACHQKEGPKFAIAGTVFAKFSETDLCQGKSGIVVEITDATGVVVKATTNAAGNFSIDSKSIALTMPYTAKVTYGGKERNMNSQQTIGACNSCHTAAGTSGAPGRIIIPE